MRCSDIVRMWDELREGGPQPTSHAAVRDHLRQCSDCQEAYEQYEGVAYCLTCLPVVEPPSGLVPRILQHIKTLQPAMPDAFTYVHSPLGELLVAFRETGITAIAICGGENATVCDQIAKRLRRGLIPATAPQWVTDTIDTFFRTFSADRTRVDITGLTDFERAALTKAAEIPPGEVRSYGWIAREIGQPHAARAVGQVMARNPVPLLYPCHRVVDSTGALHHYAYGLEIKAHLLEMEGYVPVRRGAGAVLVAANALQRNTSATPPQTYEGR